MAQLIAGPGLTLPPPQSLYPPNILNTPPAAPTNNITLAPGDAMQIPSGWQIITLDAQALYQWLDPVTTTWKGFTATGPANAPFRTWSDGVNYRIANLNQVPISATVTAAGSGYPATGTTVTASGTGGSTWVAVVGGIVNATVSITAAGSGYGVAPLVMVPAPPPPGVAATMHATISSGTVNSIIVDIAGAGYKLAPLITIIPCPFDPNFLAGLPIVNATATCTIGGAGTVGAVLLINGGAPVGTVAPTLTITGTGGSAATATANLQSTITSISNVFIQQA